MPPPPKKSLGLLGLFLLVILALGLGAYYRFPVLGKRPMHTDEAILAMKLGEFQGSGHFQYDPKDFHGPGLHYLALGWAKLAGWGPSSSWTEAELRTVPAVCGMLLILCTLLFRDALGRSGTGLAMLMMAVSPMMVFYSRYFIMEVPLVLFITLTMAALWRRSQGGGFWWLILAGLGLGLQHATKETFVLNVAAASVGLVITRLLGHTFSPKQTGLSMSAPQSRSSKEWVWVLVFAVVTSVALYSGFFKNWQAVKDSALTYLNYLERSEGSGHEKPWHYYMTLIFWRKDGLVWTEAMIGGLAVVGMIHAFFGNHQKQPSRQAFLIFLSIYTVVLFGGYSFLAYKTPWSILSGQHSLTLLAGVGAASIFAAVNNRMASLVLKILFGLGLYHLVAQTNLAIHLYAADSRNPYVYSHTSSNLLRMLPLVRGLQKTAPDGAFDVLVVSRDAGWPLPWYWRDVPTVHYVTTVPEKIEARVIVADADLAASVEARIAGKDYIKQGDMFGLRPGVRLEVWVERSLWDRHTLRLQQEESRP